MKKKVFYPILILFVGFAFPRNQTNYQNQETDLMRILKNTREYCRKLDSTALDFVCLEEVSEEELVTFMFIHSMRLISNQNVRRHKYLYDYQFIRKDGRLDEKRILLEQDGRKMNKRQTELQTHMFHYENVLFGPINLLSEERQYFFNYKIIERILVDDEKIIVIEAKPKPWVSEKIMGGTIWVSESDFSILKIEWDQEMMIHTKAIKEMSKRYKKTPVITQTIEFGFEKNGIRFPSRFFIGEVYVNKKGKKTIHSETNIIYRDYKYFTVETEVKYDS